MSGFTTRHLRAVPERPTADPAERLMAKMHQLVERGMTATHISAATKRLETELTHLIAETEKAGEPAKAACLEMAKDAVEDSREAR